MHTEYKEACREIEDIVRFTTKNSLSHTRECLERLNRPDADFRCIHVAGTNGKGSVCAFLAQILREAGISCGLFTSPHLVTMKERFRIDGEEIPEEEFCDAFEKVKAVSGAMQEEGKPYPTYFEFLFLMSAVIFSKRGVKVAVLETGLGGRLDATTAIDRPYLCVITKISYDHMQYLGNTLEEIAAEKAGILAEGVPAVYDAGVEEAAGVIRKAAEMKHVPAFPLTPDMYKILEKRSSGIDFSMVGSYDESAFLTEPFPAPYQVRNAALAVLSAKVLREIYPDVFSSLTGDLVKKGIRRTLWAGRMEEVRPGVYIDGAHNDDGIDGFIEAAVILTGGAEADLLFAVSSDKDDEGMIRRLTEKLPVRNVCVTEIDGKRKTPASKLCSIFRKEGVRNTEAIPGIPEAFEHSAGNRGDRLLFCIGSLYLAGAIKEYLGSTAHDQL